MHPLGNKHHGPIRIETPGHNFVTALAEVSRIESPLWLLPAVPNSLNPFIIFARGAKAALRPRGIREGRDWGVCGISPARASSSVASSRHPCDLVASAVSHRGRAHRD